jgi:hypothetical protein
MPGCTDVRVGGDPLAQARSVPPMSVAIDKSRPAGAGAVITRLVISCWLDCA